MEEQQNNMQRYPQINSELARHVCSEADLLATLNLSYDTLGRLRRGKGFPVVYLDLRNRVYLIDEVLEWLKRNRAELEARHGTAD